MGEVFGDQTQAGKYYVEVIWIANMSVHEDLERVTGDDPKVKKLSCWNR